MEGAAAPSGIEGPVEGSRGLLVDLGTANHQLAVVGRVVGAHGLWRNAQDTGHSRCRDHELVGRRGTDIAPAHQRAVERRIGAVGDVGNPAIDRAAVAGYQRRNAVVPEGVGSREQPVDAAGRIPIDRDAKSLFAVGKRLSDHNVGSLAEIGDRARLDRRGAKLVEEDEAARLGPPESARARRAEDGLAVVGQAGDNRRTICIDRPVELGRSDPVPQIGLDTHFGPVREEADIAGHRAVTRHDGRDNREIQRLYGVLGHCRVDGRHGMDFQRQSRSQDGAERQGGGQSQPHPAARPERLSTLNSAVHHPRPQAAPQH